MSIERDLLAVYFIKKERNGFDYAYRLPGMQRVRQAVGRLIRTEEDSGDVLLIDKRYKELRTQELFPAWWSGRTPTVGN
jgi:DNA excision repair protein ERCC-2